MRARPPTQGVQGVRIRAQEVRARPPTQPVQGVRRGVNMRARPPTQPVQGVRSGPHLDAIAITHRGHRTPPPANAPRGPATQRRADLQCNNSDHPSAPGGGSGKCDHGRQRSRCKECGGSGICEHGVTCNRPRRCLKCRLKVGDKWTRDTCGAHTQRRRDCDACGEFGTTSHNQPRHADALAKTTRRQPRSLSHCHRRSTVSRNARRTTFRSGPHLDAIAITHRAPTCGLVLDLGPDPLWCRQQGQGQGQHKKNTTQGPSKNQGQAAFKRGGWRRQLKIPPPRYHRSRVPWWIQRGGPAYIQRPVVYGAPRGVTHKPLEKTSGLWVPHHLPPGPVALNELSLCIYVHLKSKG